MPSNAPVTSTTMPPSLDMAFSHFNQPLVTPPSPTLTNPDMILPLSFGFDELDIHSAKMGDLHRPAGHLDAHPMLTSINKPHGRPLSNIPELDNTPPRVLSHSDTIASSPTLHDVGLRRNQNRQSSGTMSVTSEDLDNMRWPGFDSTDSLTMTEAEAEIQFGIATEETPSTELSEDEQWLGAKGGEVGAYDAIEEQDPLSRRADLILANAKKRLNMMEGNLRGARNSLLVSSNPNSLTRSRSALTSSGANSWQNRDKHNKDRNATANGHRARQFSPSPLSSISTIGPHNAAAGTNAPLSANAVNAPNMRTVFQQPRSSSALGAYVKNGNLAPVELTSSPIRGVRSHEVIRDARVQSWMAEVERPLHETTSQPRPATADPRSSSPSRTSRLDTMPSRETLRDDVSQISRPGSAATSTLRTQIDDLKDRISSLKERAKEESIKRQSREGSRPSTPHLAPELGAGQSGSIRRNRSYSPVKGAPSISNYTESHYEDAEEAIHGNDPRPQIPSIPHQNRELNPSSRTQDASPTRELEVDRPFVNHRESYDPYSYQKDGLRNSPTYANIPVPPPVREFAGHKRSESGSTLRDVLIHEMENAEDVYEGDEEEVDEIYEDDMYAPSMHSSSDLTSIYYDSNTAPPERHEDRADAFDYENFFLHSAMGTYSRDLRRRGSNASDSSNTSVETTRPAEPTRKIEEEVTTSPSKTNSHQVKYKVDDDDEFEDEVEAKVRDSVGAFPEDDTDDDDLMRTPIKAPYASHTRKASVDSISTLATFRTATEGEGSDEEAEGGNRLSMRSRRRSNQSQSSRRPVVPETPLFDLNGFIPSAKTSPLKQSATMNGASRQRDRSPSESTDSASTVSNGGTSTTPTSASSKSAKPVNTNIESILALLCPPHFTTAAAATTLTRRRGQSDLSTSSASSSHSEAILPTNKVYPLQSNDQDLLLDMVKAMQDVCGEMRTSSSDSPERRAVRTRLLRGLETLRG